MALELWGGHEATLNRVRDRYFDQTARSGHQDRLADLALFADLGLKALRYPVLWEKISPDRAEERNFAWADERVAMLGELRLRPILGLLHHGSGPRYTHLLDDGFAEGLASHARAVAERYPWVEDWTPVNEPLTTARFSTLYGLWYPHLKDELSCWIALLNQIDATRFAMREIRCVNSKARLIQTEDIGFCHAARSLAAHADFENARRWLTWDLLFGRVVPGHALWQRLVALGLQHRLEAIADDPCPPSVIGVNYYLSSERFIDHRLDLYPSHGRAAEGPFVNLEAVRILRDGVLGLGVLLQQVWQRYGTAIAVTECHNGSTRDEQMRWFVECWQASEQLTREGVDVRAVTAWSLLGSYDWNQLVTTDSGHYEAGVFDVRGRSPRPTALAKLLKNIARGGKLPQHGLSGTAWWHREDRLLYKQPSDLATLTPPNRRVLPLRCKERPILITGKTGTLGQALARGCAFRRLPYFLSARDELPLEDLDAIRAHLKEYRPAAVINAAGWVRIDDAESDPAPCMTANGEGPENLARACLDEDIPLVTFSSDQVFDGRKGDLYIETDGFNPVNVYGQSKAEGEQRVLAIGARALIVRTAAFFSPEDSYNFAICVLNAVRRGKPFAAASDQFISPTYVPDLVNAVLDLLLDGTTGIWHLTNQGRVSWSAFAEMVAERARIDRRRIQPTLTAALGLRAKRPADAALGSLHGALLPRLETAIDRFVDGLPAFERQREVSRGA
jgi:dTDP-4-dehydrorhamnose reductase